MGALKRLFHNSSNNGIQAVPIPGGDNPSINSTSSSARRSVFRQRNSSRLITPFLTTSSHNSKNGQAQATLSHSSSSTNGKQEMENSTVNDHGSSETNHYTSTPMASSMSSGSSKGSNLMSLKRFFRKFRPSGDKFKLPAGELHEPIDADPDLFHRYGELGKLLGTGASGSVNILKSKTDPSKVYAVKKFRKRLSQEAQADYETKVQNEFKVGDYLKHQNIIYTFELIKDYSKVSKTKLDPDHYIIMEYCPFDFFNLVMSGLMGTREIFCYFKQLINGVGFLHQNGLAHRDLKLDNCVVNEHGILKLIDFGSAVQFKKEVPQGYDAASDEIMLDPTHKLVYARGIVGSDPYLSPEVFEPLGPGYDARAADVWSIAIIYCCMILKRFPWKIPKLSDPSYRSFAAPTLINGDSLEQEMKELTVGNGTDSKKATTGNESSASHSHQHHHRHHHNGPERLFKLLPEESREVIKNMLTLDPKKRYLMPDVLADEFVQSISVCLETKDEHGEALVVAADNHIHHLVTEDDLNKIVEERDREKRLKEIGIA